VASGNSVAALFVGATVQGWHRAKGRGIFVIFAQSCVFGEIIEVVDPDVYGPKPMYVNR
jgi:hypothetical protein